MPLVTVKSDFTVVICPVGGGVSVVVLTIIITRRWTLNVPGVWF